jgi:hypothetical protein
MGSHLVGFRIQNDRRRPAGFPSIEPGGSCETELPLIPAEANRNCARLFRSLAENRRATFETTEKVLSPKSLASRY